MAKRKEKDTGVTTVPKPAPTNAAAEIEPNAAAEALTANVREESTAPIAEGKATPAAEKAVPQNAPAQLPTEEGSPAANEQVAPIIEDKLPQSQPTTADAPPTKGRRRKRRRKAPIGVILLFIPRSIIKLFKNFSRKHKLNISTKTTILYGMIFMLVFFLSSALIIITYRSVLSHTTGDADMTATLLVPLILLIVLIYPIGIALVISLGRAATQGMLKPIARITETAKKIDTQTLSIRVETGSAEDELYELAEMINHMLDKLQVAFDSQNRFVSDAAHELRTPIAVIQGYSDMLNRWGAENPDILKEGMEAIAGEAQNMKALVEKLLFLARADKKTLMIEPQAMRLDELVEEVIAETLLYEKEHAIEPGQIEQVDIVADRGLIKQALRIFIDNAIKYTDAGGRITLSCYNEDAHTVAMIVSDNGIGIEEKELPYVFDRFYKCDKSRVRDGESTGLGLSIAKWIAENHDAEVRADSAPGIGTTMTMRFFRD